MFAVLFEKRPVYDHLPLFSREVGEEFRESVAIRVPDAAAQLIHDFAFRQTTPWHKSVRIHPGGLIYTGLWDEPDWGYRVGIWDVGNSQRDLDFLEDSQR